ncbi:MAG TPA: PIN domain-containing protein [Polyangia bacterium]|nr:PIN domain-containing protein [Polyangia bacterium]
MGEPGNSHGSSPCKAVAALSRAATGTVWTSRQVVLEFLAVMSRPQTVFPGSAPMSDILDRARIIESQCRMAEDGPDVAQQLRALLAVGDTRGKQIHDANVVATMLAHRIRILLTDNLGDFARWGHLIDVQKL